MDPRDRRASVKRLPQLVVRRYQHELRAMSQGQNVERHGLCFLRARQIQKRGRQFSCQLCPLGSFNNKPGATSIMSAFRVTKAKR